MSSRDSSRCHREEAAILPQEWPSLTTGDEARAQRRPPQPAGCKSPQQLPVVSSQLLAVASSRSCQWQLLTAVISSSSSDH